MHNVCEAHGEDFHDDRMTDDLLPQPSSPPLRLSSRRQAETIRNALFPISLTTEAMVHLFLPCYLALVTFSLVVFINLSIIIYPRFSFRISIYMYYYGNYIMVKCVCCKQVYFF